MEVNKRKEDDGWKTMKFPFGMAYFQGQTVSFREGTFYILYKEQLILQQTLAIYASSSCLPKVNVKLGDRSCVFS